ncbi:MAG: type VI secretion system Vgr family protein, partial [Pirellulaceae bacterium]
MSMKQSHRMLQLATSLGDDVLLLTGFRGEEFLSRPFCFHLDLISDRSDVQAADIVGSGVHVSLELPDGTRRSFHGYVNRFITGDEDGDGRRTYRAEVVPWLWFLTRTSDCRIFQDKTIPEILTQVFSDRGFREFDVSQVRGAHPKHEYCVQYRETDFQFVSRLMEHEGIFYYFRHEEGKHTLVLGDHGRAYGTCREETVDYPRDTGTRAVRDHITSWEHTYEFRTGRFSHTDYNFKTPSNNLTTAEKTLLKVPGMDRFEFYEFPGEYGSKADGAPLAKIRMEAEEAQFDTVRGTSFCRSFSAGNRFTLGTHRHPAEERRSYVLTQVRHEAHEPMAYETGPAADAPEYRNWFSCIPADVSFRPPRTTVRPVMQGCQTAVVTGPPGEEIFPDEFGRVKVQFHWDREGQRNENSSCWIRVSQLHAGKGWGTMDLPRIGEEVIVTFLEGDPNQPIITE